MSTMTTEEIIAVGTRVRITDSPDDPGLVGQMGTVEANDTARIQPECCGGAHNYAVRLDDGRQRAVRAVESAEPVDQDSEAILHPATYLQVGDYIDVIDTGERQTVAEMARVVTLWGPNDYGITFRPSNGPQRTLAHSDIQSRRFEVYRRVLRVGDTVRIDSPDPRTSEGGYVDPDFAGATGTVTDVNRYPGDATVCREGTRLENHIGLGHLSLVVNDRVVGRNLVQPPEQGEPEVTDPIEVGTRFMWAGRVHVVISKADPAWRTQYRPYLRQWDRDRAIVAARQENNPNGLTAINATEVVAIADPEDLAGLSVEEQLRRMQIIVHRVASYEAVRRSWCDEIDVVLSRIDGLPEGLRRVDRDLGRRLVQNPRLLLDWREAGEESDAAEDDEPEESYTRQVTVSGSASWTVSESWTYSTEHECDHGTPRDEECQQCCDEVRDNLDADDVTEGLERWDSWSDDSYGLDWDVEESESEVL